MEILTDKYFKNYDELFKFNISQNILIDLLYTFYYDKKKCITDSYFMSNHIRELLELITINKTNTSFNYQHNIIKNVIRSLKVSNVLVISNINSVIRRLEDSDNKYDVILLPLNKNNYDKDYVNTLVNKIKNIKNVSVYGSFDINIYNDFIKKDVLESKFNKKYDLITCHYGYITGLSLSASYKMLFQISYIIHSLGITFNNLNKNGTLILFWTIVNIHVPSINTILILLSHAFEHIDVITDDINQNFFQGVTEYYIKCTNFKNNINNSIITNLLNHKIDITKYYDICDILNYYYNYTSHNPNHCLFYKFNNYTLNNNTFNKSISKSSQKNKKSNIIKDISFFKVSFRISNLFNNSKSSKSSKSKQSKISKSKRNKSSKSKRSKISKSNSNKSIKSKRIKISKSKSSKSSKNSIEYIERFDIDDMGIMLKNNKTQYNLFLLKNKLEMIFIDCIYKINNMLLNHTILDKEGNIKVKPYIKDLIIVNNIKKLIMMLEINNISYNKHILSSILEKEDELLKYFYSLNNTINFTLVKYTDEMSIKLMESNIDNYMIYKSIDNYDILNSYFENITIGYNVKEKLLESLNIDRAPKIVQNAYEDFTRGLSAYIISKYYKTLPHTKISNAFIKLWECLSIFNIISHNKNKSSFRVFHICEAPGQMILSCKYFVEKTHKNIKDYDWLANSLNPFNKNIQMKYKNDIFGDTYGLIKNNINKWLWGKDNTGDITNIDNIKWYREYIENHCEKGLDLIIGDGGLNTDEDPLLLQKLDLAQVIMVLACSKIKGSCIIKHFTPYIKRHTNTYNASGFFIGFLYLYYLFFKQVSLFKPYSSNPDSGEFYIIGKDFKGITEKQLQKLYNILNNFKLNDTIIPKNKIPDTFLKQIYTFLEKMSDLNTISIEKQNLLLTCYKINNTYKELKDKFNTYLQCDKLLDEDELNNILIPRYKEWIKKYNFH